MASYDEATVIVQGLTLWRLRGCLVWGDTGLSQSSTGSNADGIFVDIMAGLFGVLPLANNARV
jgi:hypothetical protein